MHYTFGALLLHILEAPWGQYNIECHYFVLFIDTIISVLFHYDNYCYYWVVYVNGHFFWTADISFLKLSTLYSAIAHLLGCFFP